MDKNTLDFVCSFLNNECSSFSFVLDLVFKSLISSCCYENLLVWSALHNFESLCIFIKEIWDISKFEMLQETSWEGICRLALNDWGTTDINVILCIAAGRGHENICRLTKEWGATNFKSMLREAVLEGHENICRLAIEWGANNFSDIFLIASEEGNEKLCRFAKESGYTNFNVMFVGACRSGRENLCRLAKEWGANDFNLMLQYAAIKGNEHLCRLAIEWGADDFKCMLIEATASGHVNICRIAKEEYGANDFHKMLWWARIMRREDMQNLAMEWMNQ